MCSAVQRDGGQKGHLESRRCPSVSLAFVLNVYFAAEARTCNHTVDAVVIVVGYGLNYIPTVDSGRPKRLVRQLHRGQRISSGSRDNSVPELNRATRGWTQYPPEGVRRGRRRRWLKERTPFSIWRSRVVPGIGSRCRQCEGNIQVGSILSPVAFFCCANALHHGLRLSHF